MTAPHRVQLRRTKGWRMPPNTVSVARPGPWGNPYRVGGVVRDPINQYNPIAQPDPYMAPPMSQLPTSRTRVGIDNSTWTEHYYVIADAAQAVGLFARYMAFHDDIDLSRLRGKNLACWCPLDQPCHADVLLELANQEQS